MISEVRNKCIITEKYEAETGEILSRFTTQNLEGSYDARLSVRILGNYIVISGSVHKFILGHNVLGGPDNIKDCCRYLVQLVSFKLGLKFPNWSEWELMRADITRVFALKSFDEVKEAIKMLRGCKYPRRENMNYGYESLYMSGFSSTLKIYHKGPEFKGHDRQRLYQLHKKYGSEFVSKEKIDFMQEISNRILRVEIEVRKRKMKYDKISNKCGCLNDIYFEELYVSEVSKIMKEGISEMSIVRSVNDVKVRLSENYSDRRSKNLMSIWSRIQIEGQDTVRRSVSSATWRRYKKDFSAIGISLSGNLRIMEGLSVSENDFLRDFNLMPGNKYEITGMFCDVKEAIRQLEVTA